jgi:hypothetical protein
MAETLLYEIEEALSISGRGCVLMPGMLEVENVTLKQGNRVKLVPPVGSPFESRIHSLDAIHNRSSTQPEIRVLVVLPASVSKQAVPSGTKLLLLEPHVGLHA